jgi:hypothetical protein
VKNENNKVDDKNIKSKQFFSSESTKLYVIFIVLFIVGFGLILGGKYLFDKSKTTPVDNGSGTNSTTLIKQMYDFSELEEMCVGAEGKKESIPSTLQQLLDFGFDYVYDSDKEKIEKPSFSSTTEWNMLPITYHKSEETSFGQLIVRIENKNGEGISSLNTLITRYDFDWRYLADSEETQKYGYVSLGGIKYGMSITDIKEYYKDFVTDLDNGIRIEKSNTVVNGTEVKRVYLEVYGVENEMYSFVRAMNFNLEF